MTAENFRNIQNIFTEKTGVALPAATRTRRPARTALLLAAALILALSLSAFGVRLFSPLNGDDLALRAVYDGGGIVTIRVENRSDKTLTFQKQLKLMRWATGEEIAPTGEVAFEGTRFAPRSEGTMTVDLSDAYDVAALEEPIEDWYYFVLTNNDFLFGQDWMCSFHFSTPLKHETPEPAYEPPEAAVLADVAAELRPYFESDAQFDSTTARGAANEAYMEKVRALLADFGGEVVPSVSPPLLLKPAADGVVFDATETNEPQYALAGEEFRTLDWDFKLLATDTEEALVLSVLMPQRQYDAGRDMPLYYYFTYEKAALSDGAYAFIYGRLISFAALERYKVWEDDTYAVYEAHALIWTDLDAHTERWLAYNTDIRFDDAVMERVQNVADYYAAHTELFYYR